MRSFLKKTINRCLKPANIELVRTHKDNLPGGNLFHDLRRVINKDSPVCLDVGANTGQTIESLLKAFPCPYIYSFEPSSATFKTLQSKNFGDRVFLYNNAIGQEKQNREFINYKNSALSSFFQLDPNEENRFRDVGEISRETVQIDTVDQFLKNKNIDAVDLLKIDTQGFDLEVLAGATNALQSGVIRNVLVELNFVRMYQGQSSAEDIVHFLGENGLLLIDFYEKVRQNHTLAWCTAFFGRR